MIMYIITIIMYNITIIMYIITIIMYIITIIMPTLPSLLQFDRVYSTQSCLQWVQWCSYLVK